MVNPFKDLKVRPYKITSSETVEEYAARKGRRYKMHKLAVANKADRMWVDHTLRSRGRTQSTMYLHRARNDLGKVLVELPFYSPDPAHKKEVVRIRKAIRLLITAVRGPNDNTVFDPDCPEERDES